MSDEETHNELEVPKCHVCESLLPLMGRINRQMKDLQTQQTRAYDEEGLRYDLDKVFNSLYSAIDQREIELLALVDERCGKLDPDNELTSLLAHLENAKSYCDEALVYTTKPELLRLMGMIHDRVEDLFQEKIPENTPTKKSEITFEDDGIPDLLAEIENFGIIFNEKDVDAAVKDNSFPPEHLGMDNNTNHGSNSAQLDAPLTNEESPVSDVDKEGVLPILLDILSSAQRINDNGENLSSIAPEDSETGCDSTNGQINGTPADDIPNANERLSEQRNDDSQDGSYTNQENKSCADHDNYPTHTNNQDTGDRSDTGPEFVDGQHNISDRNIPSSSPQSNDSQESALPFEMREAMMNMIAGNVAHENNDIQDREIGGTDCPNKNSLDQDSSEDAIIPQNASQQRSINPASKPPTKDTSDEDNVPHSKSRNHDNSQPMDFDGPLNGNDNSGEGRNPNGDISRDDHNSQPKPNNQTKSILPLNLFDLIGRGDAGKISSPHDDANESGVVSQQTSNSPVSQVLTDDSRHPSHDVSDKDDRPKDEPQEKSLASKDVPLVFSGQDPLAASALAYFVKANYKDIPDDDAPVNADTMLFSLELDPDSEQDATLTISPKKYSMEHIIRCGYMEFDKATVFEDNHVTRDGKLVNEPPRLPLPNTSWRFKNYKGALSTRPLDSTGMSYLEFWTNIEIKQIHDGRSLIFEAAVADRDVIDLHHKAEAQDHAWGVSLSHCPEHKGLCRRTWAAGKELEHFPKTLPNKPKATAQLKFGFVLLQKQKKLVVIDCKEEKVLMTAENIKITRPLWPVFGVYNTELSYVETSLVTSTNLKIEKNIAWLILQSI